MLMSQCLVISWYLGYFLVNYLRNVLLSSGYKPATKADIYGFESLNYLIADIFLEDLTIASLEVFERYLL